MKPVTGLFITILFSVLFSQCMKNPSADEPIYSALTDSVEYVGMAQCISCHSDIHNTFSETGMGKSFGHATKTKSSAEFESHSTIYDSISNFHYYPFWINDSLKILEYRLDGLDTIHKRLETIDYIIGSGQHTNSHLIQTNGYLYQAPVTFYTQKGKWDLAPGFENGQNSRFGRIIKMECLTCHNGLTKNVKGSVNKYRFIPSGIDCERCHGPGSVHVKEKLAGIIVDTSRLIDYSIVHPGKLSIDLQNELCQRCHLQGVTVLNDNNNWADFRPGMKLNKVLNVFLPEYENQTKFLMASHVERLKLSQCFQSGGLSCISCHNPHVSVINTSAVQFNHTCSGCHSEGDEIICSEEMEIREQKNNNCVNCHMPKSGSIDIPHVAITDHKIRILTNDTEEDSNDSQGRFLGLKCMTDESPSELTMAKGYLRFFEGFNQNPEYLDSAYFYLSHSETEETFETWVQYHHLKGEYQRLIDLVKTGRDDGILNGNTHYRIGEAYMNLSNHEMATSYFEKAVKDQPFNLEFQNRLGSNYLYIGSFQKAKEIFNLILAEQENFVPALSNLGTLELNIGKSNRGIGLLSRAIELDPDYELAYYNLSDYYMKRSETNAAKEIIMKLLKHQPNNMTALQKLREI